jgi:hypothetical protein
MSHAQNAKGANLLDFIRNPENRVALIDDVVNGGKSTFDANRAFVVFHRSKHVFALDDLRLPIPTYTNDFRMARVAACRAAPATHIPL